MLPVAVMARRLLEGAEGIPRSLGPGSALQAMEGKDPVSVHTVTWGLEFMFSQSETEGTLETWRAQPCFPC